MTTITQILDNYDLINSKYINTYEPYKYFKLDVPPKESIIHFYNDKNEIIKSYKFQVAGFYISNTSTWKWAWSIPTSAATQIKLVKSIFNYGLTLVSPHEIYLKSFIVNSSIEINNYIEMEIIIGLSLFLTKSKLFFKNKIYNNKSKIVPEPGMEGIQIINNEIIDDEIVSDKQNYIETYYLLSEI